MSVRPGDLYNLSDKELLERMGGAQPGSQMVHEVRMEMERRAMNANIAAAKAQVEALGID